MKRLPTAVVAIAIVGCHGAPASQDPSGANDAPLTVEVPEPEANESVSAAPVPSEETPKRAASRTTLSGLGIDELKSGSGAVAEPGHKVSVHYHGTLSDGSVFDSSRERNAPFVFGLGKGHVIKGFEEGVSGMRVGEVRRLTIPPELGYGATPRGKIPAKRP